MPEKFDWTDVETLRSQAATKLARAKKKRTQAKSAPPRKYKETVKRHIFSRYDKPALEKGAATNERQAAELTRKADKWASILAAAAQGPVSK